MMVERSTSVISLGKQVIEKIQVETASLEDGQLVYRFTDSPMCDYMVKFIGKLRAIPSAELVNKVNPTSFYQRIRISFPCKKTQPQPPPTRLLHEQPSSMQSMCATIYGSARMTNTNFNHTLSVHHS
jgi:hypothetical protein